MPDDATEGVAEHSCRLQPSINLHAPVTAFMISCSGILVLRVTYCSDYLLTYFHQDVNYLLLFLTSLINSLFLEKIYSAISFASQIYSVT